MAADGGVKITVKPYIGLVDDELEMSVSGLVSFQRVTLFAFLTEEDMTFLSFGFYVSDFNGQIDVEKDPSTGGTYIGVERHGLLWSMRPTTGQRTGLRLMKKDVSKPFKVEIYLTEGHAELSKKDELENRQILDYKIIYRYYQSDDVVAIPVREASICGTLFLPQGKGPFPGLIDMFGTAGGLTTYRAALFASRGFAALSLAYFAYEDLPQSIELHLEYFQKAVDWLYGHPLVLKTGIGMVGVSKGAALALHTALLNSKVKAVVAINPYCCHSIGIHYYKGHQQPVVNANLEDLYETNEGLVYGRAFKYKDMNSAAVIQLEKAVKTNFLFVIGEDDPTSDAEHVKILTKRLKKRRNYKILTYPGAGHLIEPPYTPHFRTCYTKLIGMVTVYGGESKAHSIAQEDSWKQMQAFLRHHLIPEMNMTYSKL